MIVEYKKNILLSLLSELKGTKKRTGFVPTMGALHEGHISLIKKSKSETDFTFSSIFVNPTQFNDPEDYNRYPKTLENDFEKLEKAGCDCVFVPSVEEMYPEPDTRKFNIGNLGEVLEGKHRPGHFNGVLQVVSKLFDAIPADNAYFGEKDFQQLCIVRWMVKEFNYSIKIIACPTIREADGLAMSSRNIRLNEKDRQMAPLIYKILVQSKKLVNKLNPVEIKHWALNEFVKNPFFKAEYFEIVFENDFKPVSHWSQPGKKRACVAAWLGKVRLIDNIVI